MRTDPGMLAAAGASGMQSWRAFLQGGVGEWMITRGLRLAMLFIAAVLAVRFINWITQRIIQHLDAGFTDGDVLVRSEATKHRQAVASVISWVALVMLAFVVFLRAADIVKASLSGLIAPATVVGAALGFGAQYLVKDILTGFFIIVEKQYGFGDLVELTILGSPTTASGTVENVTLRVTKLRSVDGEVYTVPNGQIVKAVNLSRDWARAVVDIPVPTTAALNRVNDILRQACEHARDDKVLKDVLLDAPTMMGVESIELDTVTLRMVARTLPGKQFEAGRELRGLVLRALAQAGVVLSADAQVTMEALAHPAEEGQTQGSEQQR
ncbi:MAG: mechanosensitive ion channel family protein [Mycobacteriaceae bacterium]|nr:mechanosensitive ion channel family protein [Mycobacteriaceae bacterium]